MQSVDQFSNQCYREITALDQKTLGDLVSNPGSATGCVTSEVTLSSKLSFLIWLL